MSTIVFIDIEVNPQTGKIFDIGALYQTGETFHKASVHEFYSFIHSATFLCGHNILKHDIPYLEKNLNPNAFDGKQYIDTLLLSPLLFPSKPYHALLKDDKLQTHEINNPLNDTQKARDLFYDEVNAFHQLDSDMQGIFYGLLHNTPEFGGFFKYINYQPKPIDLIKRIKHRFDNAICANTTLPLIVQEKPIELAYALALISTFKQNNESHSITPPWVLNTYPAVEQIIMLLRNKSCIAGCEYCNKAFDIRNGLKKYFGYDAYRIYNGESLQEKAVQAAVNQKSILAVFPTGGGKSITFQVPALMSGENTHSLTIVISPLQSLMKDQVDNLERLGITQAVTINGLLDPIERAKSFERVEDGSACILYISPESLRSKSIERLLLNRKIARFVIDEAHCFSAWGQDFRVDYLYIGDFIKQIQHKKSLNEPIPVSCFTATAKQKVIDDIRAYFKQKLSIELDIFSTKTARSNLHYTVLEKSNDEEKYQAVRSLIESNPCPTIIYVSRTKRAYKIAERLCDDGFLAKPYHGKMDAKEKTANQNAFIAGEIPIMVATSAFGMGVDKKDVGLVIHFDISDSLENYIQEAGRAGRDEHIQAECYVLFNEEDLSKHFILLNQTKISIKEIQQIWKAIKEITRFRSGVSNSALEIARKAGWDDNVVQIETRVTTAIAALEEAGYLKRGQNMPRVFANSILSKNAQEAINQINTCDLFNEDQKQKAIRIIKKLFSSKNKIKQNDDAPETRIDYISDHLGIVKDEVINIIHLLREANILADTKDLSAFIKRGENKNRSIQQLNIFGKIEHFLLGTISLEEKIYHIKELNEAAELAGCEQVNPDKLKTIINYWTIKHWVKSHPAYSSKNHIALIAQLDQETFRSKWNKRQELARFIVDYLYNKCIETSQLADENKEEIRVEFSVHELKDAFLTQQRLFNESISLNDIEDTLFYLSKIEAIQIEGGFMVVYNRLTIERLEQNNKIQYKVDDYQKLNQFYENKIQQIHIVGEYAQKMINNYKEALQFVEDYFQLNYTSFLNKYFKGSRQHDIKRNITPQKFKQLFGELSPTQLKIINDNTTKHIVVAAGPGSGKTRVLVHKLASLLLMEDVKHEQLLMITFSRAAATEFKKRLMQLIGNAAHYIEIKTFHSYCFDLLGKVGSLEKSDDVIQTAIQKIEHRDVEMNRITKTVLVIDEAQDMNKHEFALVETLIRHNEDMRVIAVGDDDQNIYGFRGADSTYLQQLMSKYGAVKHELVENYRSKRKLVDWANLFVAQLHNRLKETPGMAIQSDAGHVEIHRYSSKFLIAPLVNQVVQSDHIGTICILTRTNEEALQITGQLIKQNIPAKLLQTNEGFNLYDLLELRYFLDALDWENIDYLIDETQWSNAKKRFKQTYRTGHATEIVLNLITDFEAIQPSRKYKSDFLLFIQESKLDDFLHGQGETILVSTIHKAKGREFDTVYLLLENSFPATEEEKRLLYVAITRAKTRLIIYTNTSYMDNLRVQQCAWFEHTEQYNPLQSIVLHLTHKDIWLDYSTSRQGAIHSLKSGDSLVISGSDYYTANGQTVLRFSRQFLTTLANYQNKGYALSKVNVNFIVYWKHEQTDIEYKIVLPELWLEK